ncbi:hypothetical protein OH77DRAFT_1524432 [Trametes cingulata]|nr:hypothetical protein OH77DRAFT_1524432 [Trametes cingulata]
MGKLGFKCSPSPSGGPRRVFQALDDASLPAFAWDEPNSKKNGVLGVGEKARLAAELRKRYGWNEKTFRSRS